MYKPPNYLINYVSDKRKEIMDLQTAKINMMQKIMNVSEAALLDKLSTILDEEMIVGYTSNGKPLTKQQYNKRLLVAEKQIESGIILPRMILKGKWKTGKKMGNYAIVWTKQAKIDLKNIYKYWKKKTVRGAKNVASDILKSPKTVYYAKQYQVDDINRNTEELLLEVIIKCSTKNRRIPFILWV